MSDALRPGPAYRLVTPRLVVRAWEPRDAAALKEAVDSSLDHLKAWMPWAAQEPQTLPEKVQLLRRFRGLFDLGQELLWGLFRPDESKALGGIGFKVREAEMSYELGYWLRQDACGHGLATEAGAAVVQAAFVLDRVAWLELRADVHNLRSQRLAERLGFRREGVLRQRQQTGEPAPRDLVLYALHAAEYPETLASRAVVEAYDAAGERLL